MSVILLVSAAFFGHGAEADVIAAIEANGAILSDQLVVLEAIEASALLANFYLNVLAMVFCAVTGGLTWMLVQNVRNRREFL